MPLRVTLDIDTILKATGTREEFLDLVDGVINDMEGRGLNVDEDKEETVIFGLLDDLTATLRAQREAAGSCRINDSAAWIQTWLRGKWKELGFYPVDRYPVPGEPSPLHASE